MPNLDGIGAIERLLADVTLLALMTLSADAQVYAALQAGANRYYLL